MTDIQVGDWVAHTSDWHANPHQGPGRVSRVDEPWIQIEQGGSGEFHIEELTKVDPWEYHLTPHPTQKHVSVLRANVEKCPPPQAGDLIEDPDAIYPMSPEYGHQPFARGGCWGSYINLPSTPPLLGSTLSFNPQEKEDNMSETITISLNEEEQEQARKNDFVWINKKIKGLLPTELVKLKEGMRFQNLYQSGVNTITALGPGDDGPIAIVEYRGQSSEQSAEQIASNLTTGTSTLFEEDEPVTE